MERIVTFESHGTAIESSNISEILYRKILHSCDSHQKNVYTGMHDHHINNIYIINNVQNLQRRDNGGAS